MTATAATNPNQALWEKGDFTQIAATMRESGETLVERIGIRRGMRVLDLACGDGTTAVPAAQTGADVLGVDIARNLVAAGNERSRRSGVAQRCRIIEGDACDLGSIENGIAPATSSATPSAMSTILMPSLNGSTGAPARAAVRDARYGGCIGCC